MEELCKSVEGLSPFYAHGNSVHLFVVNTPNSIGTTAIVKRIICRNDEEWYYAENELEAALHFRHSNLCQAIDSHVMEGADGVRFVFLVFERMKRCLLEEINERSQRSPPKLFEEGELWNFLGELVDAHAFLQRQGTAHRDIKPANILIDSDGRLKVCDFGFTRMEIDKETIVATLLGTKEYYSPKLRQALIHGQMDISGVEHNPFRSDVYSLGICMAQLTALELSPELTNLKNLDHAIDGFLKDRPFTKRWLSMVRSMLSVSEDARPDFLELEADLKHAQEFWDDAELQQSDSTNEVGWLTASLRFAVKHARVNESEGVPCVLTLKAGKPSIESRAPLDVLCAVDLSGSMEDDPLLIVQQTLTTLLNLLNPCDRMSLVGFSSETQRIIQFTPCSESGKKDLQLEIEHLEIGDLTDLASGVEISVRALFQREMKNPAAALFVFSDITNDLTEDCRAKCLRILERNRIDNLTVSCFCLNAKNDLLETFAKAHNGACLLLDYSSQEAALRAAFDTLNFVAAKDISISLSCPPDSPCKLGLKQSPELKLISLSCDKSISFAIELQTKKLREVAESSCPVEIKIRYKSIRGRDEQVSLAPELSFVTSDERPPLIQNLHEHWLLLWGAEILREANEAEEKQAITEAVEILKRGIEHLKKSGNNEIEEKLQEMQKELTRMEGKIGGKKSR